VPETVLSASHLSKSFGKRLAVADVSFEVLAGEVFGFLGPNGAGKTTTIRMLVGLARPDAGEIRIRGLDLRRHFREAMSHVGCIVESPDLYKYLTGRENLVHFARMLPADASSRIADIARLVALEERLDDRVSTYSLGMRQRLGIAQALLGNPESSSRRTSSRRSSRCATASPSSTGDGRLHRDRSASSSRAGAAPIASPFVRRSSPRASFGSWPRARPSPKMVTPSRWTCHARRSRAP
jgi:ABC-type transport system involved in cytochrome c biogenesis ATPase subunit